MVEGEPSGKVSSRRIGDGWDWLRSRLFVIAVLGIPLVFFFVLVGWDLLQDNGVDGGAVEDLSPSLPSMILLLVVIGIGTWAVLLVSKGKWARGTSVGLVTVLVVVLAAGESFTAAEADRCDCEVGDRRGTAQAIWLAFDTVPILKINQTLGWDEPQPLSAVSSVPGDLDTPVRRWLPALAVRFAVGFILLALARGLFDLIRRRAPVGDQNAESND